MPVMLVTVPQELFISHSCETSCVNGRAHATARRRSPPHSPGVSSLVWARSRKTQPRPRDQRSRLLLGRKLSGITFSLSSVGGVGRAFRLALGIMERDVLMTGGGWGFCACAQAARERLGVDHWGWVGVLRHAKPAGRVSSACRILGWRNSPRLVARSRYGVLGSHGLQQFCTQLSRRCSKL